MPPTPQRQHLSMTDARYRILVEAVTDYAIDMLDVDGIVTSWNAGAQRFKGYTAAEIIGHHFSRFYDAEDQNRRQPQRNLETASRDGRYESEGWRIRKDGTRFWAHVIIDAIREPSGELIGFAKVTRDLTERKQTQEALRLSEERFRLLIQSVTDYAIYMLDTDGRVTNWNAGAERIKGYTPDEIVGRNFECFYRPEDRENGEPRRALSIAEKDGRFEKEGWRIRKDGSPFWANVVIDAIRDDTGKLIGFAKITRDITERMKTQRELEVAREALFQSQKIEAVGQLTGGVAHDFNNVLMAIMSSLELMRKRLPDDPKLLALLDNAVYGAQRGASLTKRMLAFARRQELDFVPIDLPELVRGMTGLMQRSLGPTVTIETRFPAKLCHVIGDPNQLELAILNLAVNARDAMPQGGALIIGAREEILAVGDPIKLPPGRYVCFSVTDSGEGMDEITLNRATEPFFTTKGAGKGTGLGLSMVHGVTEQSGGRLLLKSKLGEGTTVEVWLPAATSETKRSDPTLQAAPIPQLLTGKLIVLAVDDDVLVLMNTAAMLEDLQHTAFTAYSGEEALAILRREAHIDVVITDQAMPQMTGHQLAEAIGAEWPDIPIILASGYAELPAGAGANLLRLAKPFWQYDLARTLADAITARNRRADAPAA